MMYFFSVGEMFGKTKQSKAYIGPADGKDELGASVSRKSEEKDPLPKSHAAVPR